MKSLLLLIVLAGPLPEQKSYEPPRERIASGVVRGNKVYFDIERIPFRDRHQKPMWFRKGKPREALMDMVSYALAHGYEIKFNSTYRTYEHQMRLWKSIPNLAGKPGAGGWRTHQTGCSVDISGTIKDVDGKEQKTILYWWLNRFAKKFHFVNDVESEPWHWTYIGPIEDENIEVGGQ